MLSGAALWETARRKRFDGIKRLNCEREGDYVCQSEFALDGFLYEDVYGGILPC